MDVFNVFLLLFTEIILFVIAWNLFRRDIVSPSIVTLALYIISTACFVCSTSYWEVIFTGKAYALFTLTFILMILTEKFIIEHKIIVRRHYEYCIKKKKRKKYLLTIPEPFGTMLFVFFCGCCVYYIYRIYKTGISLGADSLLSTIGISKEKGGFDTISRLVFNLDRMASYVYVVMFTNNVFSCKESIRKNKRALVIITLTLLITFFSGQRSTAICYAISIVVAISIALHAGERSEQNKDMKKFVSELVVAAAVVMTSFYLSKSVVKAVDNHEGIIEYFLYYFGSTVCLMGKVVSDPSICSEPFVGYFGERTFSNFWQDLYSWGIVTKKPAERKWIRLGGLTSVTRAGNEYTFFVGPYIDFGFFGTLIFMVIFYAVFSYLYYHKIRRAPVKMKRYIICSVYCYLFGMVAMSFYQVTISNYSRPINILYILYIVLFCKLFLRMREFKSEEDMH